MSGTWWTREKVGEYFPVFTRDHPPLIDYLRNMKLLPESDADSASKQVAPWLKALLDQLRFLVSHVESSLLMWSIFSAGCVIITTTGPGSSSARR